MRDRGASLAVRADHERVDPTRRAAGLVEASGELGHDDHLAIGLEADDARVRTARRYRGRYGRCKMGERLRGPHGRQAAVLGDSEAVDVAGGPVAVGGLDVEDVEQVAVEREALRQVAAGGHDADALQPG